MKKDFISIIILSLERPEKTKLCISSVELFTPEDFEVILVDNGSSEPVRKEVKTLEREKVKVFFLPENIGVARGRQFGLEKAKGNFIVFLDNDMEVSPNWSTELIKRLRDDTKAGATCCKTLSDGYVQLSGRPIIKRAGKLHIDYNYDRLPLNDTWVEREHPCDVIHGGATMFRREVFDKVSYDLEYFIGYEDLDLMMQIRKNGWTLLNCPNATVYHRRDYMTEYDKKIRARHDKIDESRERFIRKWKVIA